MNNNRIFRWFNRFNSHLNHVIFDWQSIELKLVLKNYLRSKFGRTLIQQYIPKVTAFTSSVVNMFHKIAFSVLLIIKIQFKINALIQPSLTETDDFRLHSPTDLFMTD